MKYILYRDEIGADHVDIFSEQIDHNVRLNHIVRVFGMVKLVSAGRLKFNASADDIFSVMPGSHTLGLDAVNLDVASDTTAIEHGLTFF